MDGAPRDESSRPAAEALATVVYSERALEHIEHAFEHLRTEIPDAGLDVMRAISSAATSLAEHPLAGQRVHGEIREFIVSFGKKGFVALYRFVPLAGEVRVLALRHQRVMHFRP